MWVGFKIGAINVKRVIAATLNPADSLIFCDMSAESAAGASPRPTCAYFILDHFGFLRILSMSLTKIPYATAMPLEL